MMTTKRRRNISFVNQNSGGGLQLNHYTDVIRTRGSHLEHLDHFIASKQFLELIN